MREIKFRVFDKIKKQMHPVTKIAFTGLNGEARRIHFNEIHRCIEDCVLMQYTGLKDKHGIEIYEGDIVEIEGWGTGEIVQNEGRFCAKNEVEIFYWLGFCKINHDSYNVEVLSTQYDGYWEIESEGQ